MNFAKRSAYKYLVSSNSLKMPGGSCERKLNPNSLYREKARGGKHVMYKGSESKNITSRHGRIRTASRERSEYRTRPIQGSVID